VNTTWLGILIVLITEEGEEDRFAAPEGSMHSRGPSRVGEDFEAHPISLPLDRDLDLWVLGFNLHSTIPAM
jgi:hypothetical protein